jgi:hypothetical protein
VKIMLTFPARKQGGNAIVAHCHRNRRPVTRRQVGVCSLTTDRQPVVWRAVLLIEGPDGEPDDLVRLYADRFPDLCDLCGAYLRDNGKWWA